MTIHSDEPQIVSNVSGEWAFLRGAAARLGFVAVGTATAGRIGDEAAASLRSWLTAGYQGEMRFMGRTLAQRENVRHPGMLADAAVVISAALPYGEGALQDGIWQFIARHARGLDYHDTVKQKLRLLAEAVQAEFPGSRCRIFSDSAPVFERAWAGSAGIGTVGRSGALLVGSFGPRVVLGELVFTGVPSAASSVVSEPFSRCSGCRVCVDACPTGAIVSDGVVDSRKCLSFWTIERKTLAPPSFVAEKLSLLFGCDRCTEVCPAATRTECGLEIGNLRENTKGVGLSEFSAASARELSERFFGSALERSGWNNLKENARMLLERAEGK